MDLGVCSSVPFLMLLLSLLVGAGASTQETGAWPSLSGQGQQYTAFHPGQLWLDTNGNRIRAHSGGLLTVGATTYWYGADSYAAGHMTNKIINVYSSMDLYNWRFHGAAFVMNCSEIPGAKGTCYADRPKVLHDVSRGRYVLWMKSTPWCAVAESSSPLGPFRFVKRWLPNGEEAGDPTAFWDPVATRGFWVYSRKVRRVIQISEMRPNMLDLMGLNATLDMTREAPALFFEPTVGRYYLWTSHLSGWMPNAADVYSAVNLTSGAWRSEGNPTRSPNSFGSQSTFILPYLGRSGRMRFIYIADRFEPYISGPESGRYVWLPIEVGLDGALSVSWRSTWTLEELDVVESTVQV